MDGPAKGPGNGPVSADGSWIGLATGPAPGLGLGETGEGGAWCASDGCDSTAGELEVLGPLGPSALLIPLWFCALASMLSSLLVSLLLPLVLRSAKRKEGNLDELWLWRCESVLMMLGAEAWGIVVVGRFWTMSAPLRVWPKWPALVKPTFALMVSPTVASQQVLCSGLTVDSSAPLPLELDTEPFPGGPSLTQSVVVVVVVVAVVVLQAQHSTGGNGDVVIGLGECAMPCLACCCS